MGTNEVAFSARELPWMKVGTVIDKPVNVEKAIKLAGLDWEVELRDTGYRSADGKRWLPYVDRRTIVRTDTDEPFGIASASDYEIVQNREAFDFVNAINPHILAAGPLRKGRHVFMVVKAPEHFGIDVLDGDHHDLYVVLRTSHDCSKAIEVLIMALRGMCMNQLPLVTFSKQAQQSWSIRHVKTAHEKLEQAQDIIKNLDGYAKEFSSMADRLAKIDLELDEAQKVLETVLDDRPKRAEVITKVLDLFDHGDTVGYHKTGWGLVNAVGEYYDHLRTGGSITPESRFTNALSGSTKRYINRTAQLLVRR